MQKEFFFVLLFAITVFLIYIYKKLNERKRFCLGIDINKPGKKEISESTGVVILVPFWVTIISFSVFFGFFYEVLVFAVTVSVFALVGFFDDLKHKFLVKPTSWITRAVPIAIASLTFAGVFAPSLLWIVPIGLFVAGIASLQNTFAGLNGWEVGSGFLISLFVSFLLIGSPYFFIAVSLSVIIFGLLIFNFYPAKVFPGDSGTLFIGISISALIVLTKDPSLMILTSLFFLPHLIDFFVLKLLTNPKDLSQQKIKPYRLLENNSLAIPKYPDNIVRHDFAKLLIKLFGPMKERTIVLLIWIVVSLNCFFWLIVFGKI